VDTDPPAGPSTRFLIVNADDWGLTQGISAGILRAHREGIVTSTSVLAVGPAYPKTWTWLLDAPRLGVGVHLAAVGEDPPLLDPAEIPTLVDRHGRLPRTWRSFVRRMVGGRIDPADLDREFSAQLEVVSATGIPITHLDAHQHLHLLPPVRRVVLDLAGRTGVPAVRVPRFRAPTPTALGVTILAARLAARARRGDLSFPSDASGIEAAGKMDIDHLRGTLARLAAGGAQTVELGVHPGEPGDLDRTRYDWNYRWEDELAALTSPAARHAVAAHGFTLATYADLGVSRP
jgi:predicted glycoside hydrolase/deacetylase ChbG (UPF0249 family)